MFHLLREVQPDEEALNYLFGRTRRNPIAILEMGRTGSVRTMVCGGELAIGRLPDCRIRKLSLDSTLPGCPELYCEAHVSSQSLATFGWTGHALNGYNAT